MSASYVLRRPSLATEGVRAAVRIGMRARKAPILRAAADVFVPALIDDTGLAPICTLVSDTHLTTPAAHPSELDVDPGQWPWQEMPRGDALADGLQRVLADIAARAPNTVVWCGDEVDTGDAREWAAWKAAIASQPRLSHRLVPGNHDICFNRPFDEDYDLQRRAGRERVYQEHAGRLADFPVLDTVISDAGPATVILLDSCRHRSTHVLSNAVGYFGDDQLDELARILDAVRGPILVVAHHHVWRDPEFMQPDDWYNVAVDSDRLASLLGAYRKRDRANQVLVCHGHRHVQTAGVIGEEQHPITVVGMPSTTLGDKSTTGRLDGKLRYGVAGLRRDGSWGVAMYAVGELVPAGVPRSEQPATPPSAAVAAYAAAHSAVSSE